MAAVAGLLELEKSFWLFHPGTIETFADANQTLVLQPLRRMQRIAFMELRRTACICALHDKAATTRARP
jgi:hypothetical protein